MKSWTTASLAAVLAATLAACGSSSPPGAGADPGGSSGSGSGGATADLVYGCNWLFESDAQTANVAYPDTNAVYWVAALPDSIPDGDRIEIAGTTATARYFSFQIYTEDGGAESGVNDAGIVGQGAAPAAAVASGQPYTVNIVYSATAQSSGTTLVADPRNVSPRAPAHKYLIYRLYLPTGGAETFASLPLLTYVAASGLRTPLSATPDSASCATIRGNIQELVGGDAAGSSSSSGGSSSSSSGGDPARKPPRMAVFRSSLGRFQNIDMHYMDEKTNDTLGDLLIVRGQAPASPGTGAAAPLVRYWSVCSDEAHAPHRAVQCLADQDARLDTDGDFNVIIATQAPPDGWQAQFDWLPWGGDTFGEPIYRQLLADPGFLRSIEHNLLLPEVTMGAYYPDSSYCSRSVFSANLAAGPAAVFQACKNSQGTGSVDDPGN